MSTVTSTREKGIGNEANTEGNRGKMETPVLKACFRHLVLTGPEARLLIYLPCRGTNKVSLCS